MFESPPARHRRRTDTERPPRASEMKRDPTRGAQVPLCREWTPSRPFPGFRQPLPHAHGGPPCSPASAPYRCTWSRFLCAGCAFWTSCPQDSGPAGPQTAAAVRARRSSSPGPPGIPDLYPPDVNSPQMWQPKTFLGVVKCPWKIKLPWLRITALRSIWGDFLSYEYIFHFTTYCPTGLQIAVSIFTPISIWYH